MDHKESVPMEYRRIRIVFPVERDPKRKNDFIAKRGASFSALLPKGCHKKQENFLVSW
jgi:hypothetical protein